jgi:hypothetical protein
MRIISLIEEPQLVEKILKHLDLWHPQAHGPPVNKEKGIENVMIMLSSVPWLLNFLSLLSRLSYESNRSSLPE